MKEDKDIKTAAETEKEREMYAICFGILALCLISLLLLASKTSTFSILKGTPTGAVVTDGGLFKDDDAVDYVDYANLSFDNITQELAMSALLQAEKDMQEMQEAGFGVAWVNDTLTEAKKYFEGENYTALLKQIAAINDTKKREKSEELLVNAQKKIGIPVDYARVLESAKAISRRKLRAYEIKDMIRASELRINDFEKTGLDSKPLFGILSKAEAEFKEERFDDAIALLNGIEPKIDEIKSENTLVKIIYRSGKETITGFVKEHYIAIIITMLMFGISFVLSYNRIMVKLLDKKVKDMNIEKEVLGELIRKAQDDYFSKGAVAKQAYEIKLGEYKKRLLQINEQLPVVQAKLDKMLKMKRVV